MYMNRAVCNWVYIRLVSVPKIEYFPCKQKPRRQNCKRDTNLKTQWWPTKKVFVYKMQVIPFIPSSNMAIIMTYE